MTSLFFNDVSEKAIKYIFVTMFLAEKRHEGNERSR